MGEIKLWLSDKLVAGVSSKKITQFLQMMIARLRQGGATYGEPSKYREYLKRLRKELTIYEKEGNREQLLNVANYALLEYYYPLGKTKLDITRKSVTR